MTRLIAILAGLAMVIGLAAAPGSASADDSSRPFPDTIDLPDGFFPEGIAIDRGAAYVGSLNDGAIQRLDLRTGTATEFATGPGPNKISVGMDVDRRGRLWVAGGGSGFFPGVEPGFRVYDTDTGDLLADVPLPTSGFVNDVIVTKTAAWFTDSFVSTLIRVPIGRRGTIGTPELVALGGDWAPGPSINANGIVATPNGRQLIVAQVEAPEGGTAAYYLVPADGDATTVEATRIELDTTVAGADGLVLNGRTLDSVSSAGVTKIQLSGPLDRGQVVETLEVPGAESPTTADIFGPRLYVVDAKFSTFGDPSTTYQVTAIRR